MNAKQQWVLRAGIVVAVLIGVYPPWQFVVHRGPWELPRQGPYDLLFSSPQPPTKTDRDGLVEDAVTGQPLSSEETRLDTQRLAVEWITLIFLVLGLLLLFRPAPGTPAASAATEPHSPTARTEGGSTVPPPRPRTRPQGPKPEAGPYRPFRPKGQHWVVDALFDPTADELEVAMEKVASEVGHLDWVEDPWLSLDFLGPQNPHFPSWLPKAYQGRELTFQERREWFDELMRYYGCYATDSQLPDAPSSRQRLAVQSLLLMYQGEIMRTLPAPSFIRPDD